MSINILKNDDRVIHHHADREDQSQHGQCINRVPHQRKDHEGSENGNGNRQLSINNTNPNKVEPINQADYDLQRTTNMYTSLNMTEDQIQRYETASRTSMDAWKSSNAQRAMTLEQRMETQDATVKAILDASQYKNYQQWLKDNPYRN